MGPKEVEKKFGIVAERFVDYLTLAGDASDNIPGVEKVGPKTAIKWISEYGSLDEVIKNAENIKGKVGENLMASMDRLELFKTLVTIKCDVPIDSSVIDLTIGESDEISLYEQFNDLGLHGLIKQFDIRPEEKEISRDSFGSNTTSATIDQQGGF